MGAKSVPAELVAAGSSIVVIIAFTIFIIFWASGNGGSDDVIRAGDIVRANHFIAAALDSKLDTLRDSASLSSFAMSLYRNVDPTSSSVSLRTFQMGLAAALLAHNASSAVAVVASSGSSFGAHVIYSDNSPRTVQVTTTTPSNTAGEWIQEVSAVSDGLVVSAPSTSTVIASPLDAAPIDGIDLTKGLSEFVSAPHTPPFALSSSARAHVRVCDGCGVATYAYVVPPRFACSGSGCATSADDPPLDWASFLVDGAGAAPPVVSSYRDSAASVATPATVTAAPRLAAAVWDASAAPAAILTGGAATAEGSVAVDGRRFIFTCRAVDVARAAPAVNPPTTTAPPSVACGAVATGVVTRSKTASVVALICAIVLAVVAIGAPWALYVLGVHPLRALIRFIADAARLEIIEGDERALRRSSVGRGGEAVAPLEDAAALAAGVRRHLQPSVALREVVALVEVACSLREISMFAADFMPPAVLAEVRTGRDLEELRVLPAAALVDPEDDTCSGSQGNDTDDTDDSADEADVPRSKATSRHSSLHALPAPRFAGVAVVCLAQPPAPDDPSFVDNLAAVRTAVNESGGSVLHFASTILVAGFNVQRHPHNHAYQDLVAFCGRMRERRDGVRGHARRSFLGVGAAVGQAYWGAVGLAHMMQVTLLGTPFARALALAVTASAPGFSDVNHVLLDIPTKDSFFGVRHVVYPVASVMLPSSATSRRMRHSIVATVGQRAATTEEWMYELEQSAQGPAAAGVAAMGVVRQRTPVEQRMALEKARADIEEQLPPFVMQFLEALTTDGLVPLYMSPNTLRHALDEPELVRDGSSSVGSRRQESRRSTSTEKRGRPNRLTSMYSTTSDTSVARSFTRAVRSGNGTAVAPEKRLKSDSTSSLSSLLEATEHVSAAPTPQSHRRHSEGPTPFSSRETAAVFGDALRDSHSRGGVPPSGSPSSSAHNASSANGSANSASSTPPLPQRTGRAGIVVHAQ